MEVDFIVNRLALEAPCRILDVACGHGRHANALAALGHRVTGTDISRGFLDQARADAAARQLQVDYREQDMRQLQDVAAFDVTLCLFTAFGYFDDAGNAAVLQAMARALVPGGRLLLDIINRDRIMRHLRSADVNERGDDLMIDRTRFDFSTGRCITKRTYLIGGRRIEGALQRPALPPAGDGQPVRRRRPRPGACLGRLAWRRSEQRECAPGAGGTSAPGLSLAAPPRCAVAAGDAAGESGGEGAGGPQPPRCSGRAPRWRAGRRRPSPRAPWWCAGAPGCRRHPDGRVPPPPPHHPGRASCGRGWGCRAAG